MNQSTHSSTSRVSAIHLSPSSRARSLAVLALALSPLTLAACSGSSDGASSTPASSTATSAASGSTSASRATATMAARVTASNTWAKAADSGMSAAFGTLKNTGTTPVVVTGATGDAGPMQLHVTVKTASGMEMKETKAFSIPAGGSLSLEPGGSHLMFMNLTKALKAGDAQKLTVRFEDGSTADVTFPVRAYDGAKEKYSGAHSSSMAGMSSSAASSAHAH